MTIENSTNDKAVGPMAMLSVFDNMVEISMLRDSLLILTDTPSNFLAILSNSFVIHITGDDSWLVTSSVVRLFEV